MKKTFLLETNVIVGVLGKGKRKLADVINRVSDLLLEGHVLAIPAICYYELKRGWLQSSAANQMEEFSSWANENDVAILLLDKLDYYEQASAIYASVKPMGVMDMHTKDADILIAAMVKHHDDYVLMTKDKKDFKHLLAEHEVEFVE
jgi:predicted nucleic acid-binding protein